MPAAMLNLPSDALQYIMSGVLGRWFRQHSLAENKHMLHRLLGQQPSQAEDPGKLSYRMPVCASLGVTPCLHMCCYQQWLHGLSDSFLLGKVRRLIVSRCNAPGTL